MPRERTLAERGHDAALAYIERVGMSVVDEDCTAIEGPLDIMAFEANSTLVGFQVVVQEEATKESALPDGHSMYSSLESYRDREGLDVPIRCDTIVIRVIRQDRALLRHDRGAYPTEGE